MEMNEREDEHMMTPTVGRVVYYYDYRDGPPIAAIITDVRQAAQDRVDLILFRPGLMPEVATFVPSKDHSVTACWDWMPYQKQKAAAGDHNSESAEPRPERSALDRPSPRSG